jgi:hypothetical protein
VGEVITEPGVYYDLPAEVYHAQHDWLSASGIKRLIPPSTPAHFKAAQGSEDHAPHFDIGKAVHRRILGAGEEVVVIDAPDWRSKAAREARDAAYEQGKVPILAADDEVITGMATSLAGHPEACRLLSDGKPEVSLFWVDPESGVKCRARLDWLPDKVEGRRLIAPDLKTAASAAPSEFAKAAGRYGYYAQQRHYLDGIKACGLDANPAFLFVVIEKSPPYLPIVGQFAERDDLILARRAVERARLIFKECTETGVWPGYPGGVVDLELPKYIHYDLAEFLS